ncbi:MAG: xanthine/uracil/vitamin C permease [Eubacteriaceae bacterium]|nr:xanthine/uracil/vitamin C permease [Eubacteriaceae bacterium]
MIENKTLVPWFRRGDIGGMAYAITNNIVNYLIVIATLSGVLGWPDEIVFGYVIPGMSVGLLLSGLYYAYMARKLSKKEGRADVTALPSGVSTPAMFVMLYGVVMPLSYAVEDPELAWSAATAACFIGGAVEFFGGIIGPWVKAHVPRAALLGTVAGIGFIWMSTQGLFDIYSDPMIGVPVMFVAVVGIFGGYLFPKKIPPLIVAIIGGIIYAACLGRVQPDFTGIGFYFPNPVGVIQHMLSGFAIVTPYLSVIIPVEVYNFIETMDNVEAANAAGDNYSVREAQFADGICTMLSALCGGVVPNTVWLGHASLKKTEAGVGYSAISGIVLGAAGIFGLFTFLNSIVPPAVCAITYLWCATVMVAQAFKDTNPKHYAAVGVAMIPPVADYLYTQVTGSVGLANIWTSVIADGTAAYDPEITQAILDAGVMWNGVPAVKAGAIVTGIILGTIIAFVIDKRLDKVAITSLIGCAAAAVGLIHSAQLGFYPTSPFTIAYLIMAVLAFILHLGRDSWFKGPDDYDYV